MHRSNSGKPVLFDINEEKKETLTRDIYIYNTKTMTALAQLNSSTYFNWSHILFVRTTEIVQIGSSTITQIYDPINLYWLILTLLIAGAFAVYVIFKWMYR